MALICNITGFGSLFVSMSERLKERLKVNIINIFFLSTYCHQYRYRLLIRTQQVYYSEFVLSSTHYVWTVSISTLSSSIRIYTTSFVFSIWSDHDMYLTRNSNLTPSTKYTYHIHICNERIESL